MDIFITKQEFIEGVSWYWESGDTDTWFYDSINNIGAELQSYPYEWLPKYDG